MFIKTSELTGTALDWAVAKATGTRVFLDREYKQTRWRVLDADLVDMGVDGSAELNYSTNWSQGGPIIERERIELHNAVGGEWAAHAEFQIYGIGPTPLIAAMRCYVASKLGDEVDVPWQLAGEQT